MAIFWARNTYHYQIRWNWTAEKHFFLLEEQPRLLPPLRTIYIHESERIELYSENYTRPRAWREASPAEQEKTLPSRAIALRQWLLQCEGIREVRLLKGSPSESLSQYYVNQRRHISARFELGDYGTIPK